MDCVAHYPVPSNLDELKNAVEHWTDEARPDYYWLRMGDASSSGYGIYLYAAFMDPDKWWQFQNFMEAMTPGHHGIGRPTAGRCGSRHGMYFVAAFWRLDLPEKKKTGGCTYTL